MRVTDALNQTASGVLRCSFSLLNDAAVHFVVTFLMFTVSTTLCQHCSYAQLV